MEHSGTEKKDILGTDKQVIPVRYIYCWFCSSTGFINIKYGISTDFFI